MNFEEFIKSYDDENERPLDNIENVPGMCGILRKIGCVGDSLSSGEFETLGEDGKKHYNDLFDYSWGQFIARAAGNTVYNFSRGGMTAKEYINSFAEKMDYWDKEKMCNAYIIALGVNDILNAGGEIGTTADICKEDYTQNTKNFAGYYSAIIQRLKEISPDAKFFLMTMPREAENGPRERQKIAHAELLYKLSEYFDNTYVLDLHKYAPMYDEKFKKKFFLNNHMNPLGYLFTANMVMSYIDYIIRHNAEDFSEIGLIGTGIKNIKQ